MFAVFQFFSIPFAVILIVRAQWFLLPLPIVTWFLSSLTRASMSPEAGLASMRRDRDPAKREMGDRLARAVQYTCDMVNPRRNPDPPQRPADGGE